VIWSERVGNSAKTAANVQAPKTALQIIWCRKSRLRVQYVSRNALRPRLASISRDESREVVAIWVEMLVEITDRTIASLHEV